MSGRPMEYEKHLPNEPACIQEGDRSVNTTICSTHILSVCVCCLLHFKDNHSLKTNLAKMIWLTQLNAVFLEEILLFSNPPLFVAF